MKKEIVARLGAIGALVCVAGAGYLFLQHSGRDKTAAAAVTGPADIPVTTAVAEQKDVPLYVRGIGTVQAYNMAIIRTRVDGEIVKVAFQEGQDVKAGDPLFQIDPRPFQAALDEAERDAGAQPGAADRRRARPQPLHPDGEPGLPVDPAARSATGESRRAQGLDRGRRGVHAHGAAQPRLCQHPRAVRRPHRHPPGRYRQPRAGLAGHPPGQHHPDQADLRQFHRAAGRQRRCPAQPGRRRAGRHRLRQQRGRAGARQAVGDRQPDRPDDRHAPPQGHLRERRRAAVAGPIRQCAPAACRCARAR